MNVHILHNLRDEPWGGGNQFLKALREQWRTQGIYKETLEGADAILINSYPFGAEHLIDELCAFKKKYPRTIVVYRLDGPISCIRERDREIDEIICVWNEIIADGIIFQSAWSKQKNKDDFQISSSHETIIHNASDQTIFFPRTHTRELSHRIKLIATSWSANPRKGFDVYQFLDEHLDFTKYQMTFVGNSPVSFKHIHMIAPVDSITLAPILREHDLFITASKNDPCSNSLIEALSCGLPAVVLNDGGHPELVQSGGERFVGAEDVLETIDRVAAQLPFYHARLPTFQIADAANHYLEFIQHIWNETHMDRYKPKHPQKTTLYQLKANIFSWKLKNLWNKLTGSKK